MSRTGSIPKSAAERPTSFPLNQINVLLLENVHDHARELLENEGFTVEVASDALEGDELIAAASEAHILGIRSKTRLEREFFERVNRLWSVGCFCIGTNQVDLDAAADRGIAVFNAPFSNTRSVAELTISEIIALHRRLVDRSRQMHEGRWFKIIDGANEIRGRTLGIVGYGRIGSQVSVLAESLGMRVIYYDPLKVLALGNAQPVESLDALLKASDVVTLHVPSTHTTHGMIGAVQLRKMREGSFLINNARGEVVDLDALAQALDAKHLAGCAVDVFPTEPRKSDDAFASPLAGLTNVIMTPHIGGNTLEAQRNIADEVATKLIKHMNNGSTTTAVNLPEVELPQLHPEMHRILHFHRNVPGVLSEMHRIIADLNVNISAEYLQSNASYGYVILDVDPANDDAILKGLRQTPNTIRVRALF